LVVTDKGSKRIADIKVGDIVKCRDIDKGKDTYKRVVNLFNYANNKPTIRVKLKNGCEIIATADHKFYYEGGWHSLRNILSLIDGSMETNT